MQECKDYIKTVKLKNLLSFYHKGRDKQFTEKVWVLLNCHLTHQEDFTIQLKNIMQGEGTFKHKDKWNCMRNGYTKTLTLSFMWVDAQDELWSCKLVTNGCFKAGNFLDKVYQLMLLLTRMKSSMEKLDHDFKEVMHLQREAGGYWYPNGLTHKMFPNLVLETCSPWIKHNIGNGVKQKLMGFTAGPVQDIQLVAPTTIVYKYHTQCKDV